MATINTATGPIDSSELGFTLSHEHVILTSAGIPQVFPDFVDRDGTIERAVRDLKAAHDAGVRTIIDVTTMDLGRDVELLATVSRESGVNIICATGIWIDIPRLFWTANVDSVAKLFVREIRDGMEATGIKPGVIKVATNVGGVTPEGEKILRAAARASLETGIPISTHTFAPERSGNEQMAIFEDEKLDLSLVCIGHSDDSTDLDYLAAVASKGAWLGMDHLTFEYREALVDLKTRLATIKQLIDGGFADRLMFGHDWGVELPILDPKVIATRDAYNPHGYGFVSKVVIPQLKDLGVTDETVQKIMVENPRRYLEGGN